MKKSNRKFVIGLSLFLLFSVMNLTHAQVDDIRSQLSPEELEPSEAEIQRVLKKFEKQDIQNSLERNPSLKQALDLMQENINAFGDLQLVPEQKEELRFISDQTKKSISRVLGSKELSERDQRTAIMDLKQDAMSKMVEVLLPEQLETLMPFDIQSHGLPKALVKSPLGEVLELTEEQKKKIEKESEKLAREFEEFAKKMRQRSYDIVFDTLTEDQREKVVKAYAEETEYLYSWAPIELTYSTHAFSLPEDAKEGASPIEYIRQVPIEKHDDK